MRALSPPYGNETKWLWNIVAVSGPATQVKCSGYDDNLNHAKADVARNWPAWLALAGLSEVQ